MRRKKSERSRVCRKMTRMKAKKLRKIMPSITTKSSWSSFRLSPVTIWTISSSSINIKSGPQTKRKRKMPRSGRDSISNRVTGCRQPVVLWSLTLSSSSLRYRRFCSTRAMSQPIGCQNSSDPTWSHNSRVCQIWTSSGTLPKKVSVIIFLMNKNRLTQVQIK